MADAWWWWWHPSVRMWTIVGKTWFPDAELELPLRVPSSHVNSSCSCTRRNWHGYGNYHLSSVKHWNTYKTVDVPYQSATNYQMVPQKQSLFIPFLSHYIASIFRHLKVSAWRWTFLRSLGGCFRGLGSPGHRWGRKVGFDEWLQHDVWWFNQQHPTTMDNNGGL